MAVSAGARAVPVVAAIVATIAVAAPSSAGAQRAPAVAATQELATLLTSHRLASAPRAGASTAGSVPASRPITGGPTVLPVTGHATAPDGGRWLRVRVPGRPNGRQAWIARPQTRITSTSWHVVVKSSSRRVRVYRRGRLVRSFAAIVGKPSTPTPRGRFFVEESVRMRPGSAGTPFALATSARSNVLQEFAGGPGQIALHGVGNIGGTPGTAVSHGCVRLADGPIRWLAARIAPGVPVTISR